MIVLLNGRFVSDAEATVSVFDRGFLYGDGLFETLRVVNGRPFRWTQHLDRLEQGAAFLGIAPPFAREALEDFVFELVARNRMPDSILRLSLSRGTGARGYSPVGASNPTLVMTLHPVSAAPEGWRAHTASLRIPAGEAMARFKTCNKLVQVLARAEAEAAGADEALLLNTDGHVVEAASGNLFWIERGAVWTPPLADGILPGVTRAVVFELCDRLQIGLRESTLRPAEFAGKDAAFVTQSSHGIVGLTEIDGVAMGESPLVSSLSEAYATLVREECR